MHSCQLKFFFISIVSNIPQISGKCGAAHYAKGRLLFMVRGVVARQALIGHFEAFGSCAGTASKCVTTG